MEKIVKFENETSISVKVTGQYVDQASMDKEHIYTVTVDNGDSGGKLGLAGPAARELKRILASFGL